MANNGWISYSLRKSHKREKMMAKRRAKAAIAVRKAIECGDLPPAKYMLCSDCDRTAECYDHRDYRKPLDVWPVCAVCDALRGAGEPYDGAEPHWKARMLATKARLAAL